MHGLLSQPWSPGGDRFMSILAGEQNWQVAVWDAASDPYALLQAIPVDAKPTEISVRRIDEDEILAVILSNGTLNLHAWE